MSLFPIDLKGSNCSYVVSDAKTLVYSETPENFVKGCFLTSGYCGVVYNRMFKGRNETKTNVKLFRNSNGELIDATVLIKDDFQDAI